MYRDLGNFPALQPRLSCGPAIELAAQFVLRDPLTRLRPAEAADQPFIRHLFKTVRAEDFAGAGLPQAALDTLLELQYRAQAAGYAARFPDAAVLIVLREEEPIGRLILAARDSRWRIVDIVLLPTARGRGIGTDIFEAIARAAHEAGACELTLSVLSTNVGARRLYARLGFCEDNSEPYIEMTRHLDR